VITEHVPQAFSLDQPERAGRHVFLISKPVDIRNEKFWEEARKAPAIDVSLGLTIAIAT